MIDRTRSIPEMLGFPRDEPGHERAYNQVSYQARYILYEDEAEDLIRRHAPNEAARAHGHGPIDRELHLRYAQDPEYRKRVDGGYPAMEVKMRAAGVIPEEEEAIKRTMNRLLGSGASDE